MHGDDDGSTAGAGAMSAEPFYLKYAGVCITVQQCPTAPPWALLTLGPVTEQNLPGHFPTGEPMTLALTNTQQCGATWPSPVDKKGQPAPVQAGSIVFTSSDVTVATATADATNPYKCLIVAVGNGTCNVNISADADLGDGVNTIHGVQLDVTVTGGMAVGFGDPTVETPVEQP